MCTWYNNQGWGINATDKLSLTIVSMPRWLENAFAHFHSAQSGVVHCAQAVFVAIIVLFLAKVGWRLGPVLILTVYAVSFCFSYSMVLRLRTF